MSTTSPQKRRATMMRQTRSMARISDFTHFAELSSTSKPVEQRPFASSSSSSAQPRNPSPRKARASQAAELESFDPDTPDTSLAACMESPVKGRFDDFEFELEASNPEVPTRRRRIAPPLPSSTSPSADVGLPRSRTSANLGKSRAATSNTLLTSRKENSRTAVAEEVRPGASPIKPVATLPRASRLHGPTPSLPNRTSSQPSAASSDARKPVSLDKAGSAEPLARSSASDPRPVASGRDSSHRLVFGASDIKSMSDASAKRNPFIDSADANSLALLGEPRHSPVKRFQAKTEFIISSPDRPDRKPINLLELKPSPGKAQRGIFRHNSAQDDDDDDQDDWDEESNTVDEIRLVKGPAPKRDETSAKRERLPSSSGSAASAGSASSSSRKHSMPRSTTSLDVKHTLSTETSDALASLEASLAKLKAKTRDPPASSAAATLKKKEEDTVSTDAAHKRELGTARPFGMTSSRTMVFRNKATTSGSDSSFSARSSTADQSNDSGVFKRPSGRISALAKSRETSSDFRSLNNPTLSSSTSMMSFGAPRLPGYSELGVRPSSRPPVSGSRTSSLDMARSSSRAEEEAAQQEEEARVAEANRQAELKAAKRRSMASLSSGMPPPPVYRREPETAKTCLATTTGAGKPPATARSVSSSSSTGASASTSSQPPTEAELAEARKAAKAARRRSLYTCVPTTKREDGSDADRSLGNVSSSLVVTSSSTDAASETDASTAKKPQRFLRGLTVLVDVRDQDGQDASACWIDMLKEAGAKVMVRFGERKLTHIVYKSGRPSTLHSYRALDDPKPHVVGIGWVVACLEQAKKADEAPYLVEVAKQAIFTTRRRSLVAPKQAPPSANIAIRELPEEKLKDVEEARRKLLLHAPAVPSPLRRKISSRTLLASRLAQTSLRSSPSKSDASGPSDASAAVAKQQIAHTDSAADNDEASANDGDPEMHALLNFSREEYRSILSQRLAAVPA